MVLRTDQPMIANEPTAEAINRHERGVNQRAALGEISIGIVSAADDSFSSPADSAGAAGDTGSPATAGWDAGSDLVDLVMVGSSTDGTLLGEDGR